VGEAEPHRRRWTSRSLVVRLAVLAVIFLAVPAVLYEQFRAADTARQRLLLDTIRDKGALLSAALGPVLAQADAIPYFRLGEELARYQSGTTSLKLLLKPAPPREGGFFYVAASPPVPTEALEFERRQLLEAGVLQRLEESCDGALPLAMRVERPGGALEILTSISSVKTAGGCWSLVVADALDALGATALGRPYWRSTEVQVAAAIYLALALFVLTMFFDLWRSLTSFGRMARTIRLGGGHERFVGRNRIPELTEVAAEFDRMVDTLAASGDALRRTAEDTAHAFKTPLAIIRQSAEPLRNRLDPGDARGAEALAAVEQALDRLDGLVAQTRNLDRATADLLDPPRERIALSALAAALAESYRAGLAADGPRFEALIEPGIAIIGGVEMVETVIENLVDNALSFTPAGRGVRMVLGRARRRVTLLVEDEGPGVPPEMAARIFDRYVSHRPDGDHRSPNGHSGLGLWIVKRNVEAMGGTVAARNRPAGGFAVRIEWPEA